MISKRGGDMVFDVKYRLLVVVESNNVQYSMCLFGEDIGGKCSVPVLRIRATFIRIRILNKKLNNFK